MEMNLTGTDTLFSQEGNKLSLQAPQEFDFAECLVFLGRSKNECLHHIEDKALYKLLKIDNVPVLLRITTNDVSSDHNAINTLNNAIDTITIQALNHKLDKTASQQIANYVSDWFDLARDLRPFYKLAGQDSLLSRITAKYYGLRMLGIPDLFEALTWAMIGQRINLTFAYTLKRRFVEAFGEHYIYAGETYWLYPTPKAIAQLTTSDLTSLQFTGKKSEYIIELAQKIHAGELSKEALLQLEDFANIEKALISLRGVGKWTANYVMMKCLKYMSAFPIEDVGLHNALKQQLGLESKPTMAEIKEMAVNWSGWEAYATFYLWRSLYE